MQGRVKLIGLVVAVGLTIGAAALAIARDAGDVKGLAQTPAAQLKLGEEFSSPSPEEEQATKVLTAMMVGALKAQPGPTIVRDQHPKHHGCVRATFTVAEGLPEDLRVGIFREPRTYQALLRFSNGGSLVDNEPDARGLAIKLLDIPGPSLIEGEAEAGTHDFIFISLPVFFAKDPKNLVEFFGAAKALGEAMKAGDTTKAGEIKAQFPTQFTLAQAIKKLGTPSPLELTYDSETPYRLGKYAVKCEVSPDAAKNASGLPPITKDSSPNAMREAMIAHLTSAKKAAAFTFGVHIQTDPVKEPVEDSMVLWDSKAVTLATIAIPPQEFARDDQLTFCENLSLTPWHAREEHRPLGGINRARKVIYQATSAFRHDANKVARKEPTIADVDLLFKALGPGNRGVGGVLVQPPRGVGFLNHVGRVDSSLQSPVEPKLHKAAKPVAVCAEKLAQRPHESAGSKQVELRNYAFRRQSASGKQPVR
jgi:hypothetical protein